MGNRFSELEKAYDSYEHILPIIKENRKRLNDKKVLIEKFNVTEKKIPNAETELDGIFDIMDLVDDVYRSITDNIYDTFAKIKKDKLSMEVDTIKNMDLLGDKYNLLSSKIKMWKNAVPEKVKVKEKVEMEQLYSLMIKKAASAYNKHKKEGKALIKLEASDRFVRPNNTLHNLVYSKMKDGETREVLQKRYGDCQMMLSERFREAVDKFNKLMDVLEKELSIYNNRVQDQLQ